MGYTLGIPSLKLNLVGTKSKHCGDFMSVAEEALKERKGHDPDIDPDRAALNLYVGYQTAAELFEYSEKHCTNMKDKSGRKIRKDAVRMCATIIKPPAAYMDALTLDEQKYFLDDSLDVLKGLVGEENVKSLAYHFDEQGAHLHVFWEPMTDDGRLCAKEKHNLQFFGALNSRMPEHLRSRGWDIDDCNAYDAAEKELSEKDKAEKRKQRGRSSAVYKRDMEREVEKLEVRATELQVENAKAAEQLDTNNYWIDKTYNDYVNNKQLLEQQEQELESNRKKAKKQRETYDHNQKVLEKQQFAIEKKETIVEQVEQAKIELETTYELINAANDLLEERAKKLGDGDFEEGIKKAAERSEQKRFLKLFKRFIELPVIKPLWEKFIENEKIKNRDERTFR